MELSPEQRKALDSCLAKSTGITAEELVEQARSKDHPLHELIFDRSKSQAAEQWYLMRARLVLRSYFRLKPVPGSAGVKRPVRRSFHVRVSEDREAYVRTEVAVKSYRDQLEEECRSAFLSWVRKWDAVLGEDFVDSVAKTEEAR